MLELYHVTNDGCNAAAVAVREAALIIITTAKIIELVLLDNMIIYSFIFTRETIRGTL